MTGHTHTHRGRVLCATTAILFVAVIAFAYFSTGVVNAAFGTLYSSGATAPGGMLWLPGPTGNADGNLWVSDHAQGFGRVDCVAGNCTFNALSAVPGDGQAAFDRSRNLLYVPDASRQSQGITRYTYNPATKTLSDPVLIASAFAADRPVACALSSNGNQLYISFLRTGNIVKVTGAPGNAPSAGAVVASTSDGGGASSLAMVGTALYLAEETGVKRINSVSVCAGACVAASTGTSVFAPLSLAYDGSTYLYIGDATNVHRFRPSTGELVLYANQGTSGGGAVSFVNVSGLGVDPSGNVYVGDDPTNGALLLQGHIWRIPVGGDPLPPPPPPANASTLYAGNATAPGGMVWLPGASGNPGNLWVADHLQGFGRLDETAPGGPSVFNATTAVAGDGQPAFDSGNNFVYVPDSSAHSVGIIRYRYNRTTRTLSSPVAINPTVGGATLGANRPFGCAISGTTIYVSFLRNGNIVKITNPHTATPTTRLVAQTATGGGGPLAFASNRLYIAEDGALTRINSIGSCAGACVAASLGVPVFAPMSLVFDSSRNLLYIGDTTSVRKYSLSTLLLTTVSTSGNVGGTNTPFQNISGLGIRTSNGVIYAGDDPTAGAVGLQGHIWKLPTP